MPVYKYVSASVGAIILESWHLRLTPPAEFNDPFELRPAMLNILPADRIDDGLESEMKARAAIDLADMLAPQFPLAVQESERVSLCKALLGQLAPEDERQVLTSLRTKLPLLDQAAFVALKTQIAAQMPLIMDNARRVLHGAMPAVNSAIRHAMTDKISNRLGVVCLTRDGNQPLMWAHYADCHKGMLLEFDETHSCFNRTRSAEDDFGFLRPVVYSTQRPELKLLNDDEDDRSFEIFALTKAQAWSYEQEVRLIWALHAADRKVPTGMADICLIACPPSALRSVTLGCKVTDTTCQAIRGLLAKPETRHVLVRRAKMHETAFELEYEDLPASPNEL